MGYPGYPTYPLPEPSKPPRSTTDLTISIAALVLTVLVGTAVAVLGVFALAFLDYCPPESCSAEGAATAVFASVGIAAVIAVAGLVVTSVQLARRKLAWPFAVGTLTLCGVTLAAGAVGFFAAVGG